EAALEL
ncbi:hypothetical protein MKD33_19910, partial [Chromobacterium piscinae]